METWPEMSARHKREKLDLIKSFVDVGAPAAAKALNMNESQLRSYAYYNDISFRSLTVGQTKTRAQTTAEVAKWPTM